MYQPRRIIIPLPHLRPYTPPPARSSLSPSVYQMFPVLDNLDVLISLSSLLKKSKLIPLVKEENPRSPLRGYHRSSDRSEFHWHTFLHKPNFMCMLSPILVMVAVGVDLWPLSTRPLIIFSAASTFFFDILSTQTNTSYISLRLRMASYIHNSVEDLTLLLLPMAHISWHIDAVRPLHLFSDKNFHEAYSLV